MIMKMVDMSQFLKVLFILHIVRYSYSTDFTKVAFGSVTNLMPAAFGDFDLDEATDLFMITEDGLGVEILLGSQVEPYFRTTDLRCKFKEYKITSVVPADFDGDALMDVLVTATSKKNEEKGDYNLRVYVFWGGVKHLNCCSEDNPYIQMRYEPLAITNNINMTIQLFGVNREGVRMFWTFNKSRDISDGQPMAQYNSTSSTWRVLREPHSHAFLDLNDDNSADLYLTGNTSFEVWLWNNTIYDYTFSNIIDLPRNIHRVGQTLFMDIEISNRMDQILPVCFDQECNNSTLYVYSSNKWYNLNINFKDESQTTWGFAVNGLRYTNAITLRAGDFNNDGYADMLVSLRKQRHHGTYENRVFLLENVPCLSGCDGFSRTFEVLWNAFGSSNKNTIMGAFFDFQQDGILDIIFVHLHEKIYNISAFKNSLDYDANFMKVMVATGLASSEMVTPQTILGSTSSFGTSLPGPKISYITLTQLGETRVGTCTQLPQSAYFSLYLPYIIFGLGRTPNFVEELTVGIFNQSRIWTQIIPNSQLVVIPYPPDQPDQWKAKLFVTPSKIILQSVVALLGTCIVIILIILIMHWKEKREDKLEKLQDAHGFQFGAM